ncbi:hypothetical protein MRY87_11955 [bacterium]|nr:hypothetical protein [bacterium]
MISADRVNKTYRQKKSPFPRWREGYGMKFFCFITVLSGGLCLSLPETVRGEAEASPLSSSRAGTARMESLTLRGLRLESIRRRMPDSREISAQLLSVREEQALYQCSRPSELPGGWDFIGRPVDRTEHPKCFRLLQEIRELEPHSLLHTCIAGGRESESCSKFFLNQQTLSYSEAQEILQERLVIANLGNNTAEVPSRKEQSSLRTLQLRYTSEKDEEKKEEYRAQLLHQQRRMVRLSCREQPLVFYRTLQSLGTTVERFSDAGDHELRNIKRMIQEYQKLTEQREVEKPASPFGASSHKDSPEEEKKEAKDPAQQYIRIRAITPYCKAEIDRLLTVNPLSATALCLREGAFHPTCIQAQKEREKEKRKPKKTTSGPVNSAPTESFTF